MTPLKERKGREEAVIRNRVDITERVRAKTPLREARRGQAGLTRLTGRPVIHPCCTTTPA